MKKLALQFLIDLMECDVEFLNDPFRLKEIMVEAAEKGELQIFNDHFHRFELGGVNGVISIDGHLTIRTWPKRGHVAIDIFSCGERAKLHDMVEYLIFKFKPKARDVSEIYRGTGHDDQ